MNTKNKTNILCAIAVAGLAVATIGEVLHHYGKTNYDTLKLLRVGAVLAAIPIVWIFQIVQKERSPKLSTAERLVGIILGVSFIAWPSLVYVRSIGHLTLEQFKNWMIALIVVQACAWLVKWLTNKDAAEQAN